MDLWAFVAIFFGAIGALTLLAILSQYSGASSLIMAITNTLNFFWQIIKTAVDFVLNHLPTPFKVLLVFILLSGVGGMVYAVTFGATHVCDSTSQTVYVSDSFYQGFAFQHWPYLVGVERNVSASVDVHLSKQNLLKRGSVVIAPDGTIYNSTEGLVPVTMLSKAYIVFGDIVEVPTSNQLQTIYPFGLFTSDEKLLVSICQNRNDYVCVLNENRRVLGGGGTTLSDSCDNTQVAVGQLNYWFDKDANDIEVEFINGYGERSPFGIFGRDYNILKCANNGNSSYFGPFIADLTYNASVWSYVTSLGRDSSFDARIPLYNGDFGPMKVTKEGTDFFDVQDTTRKRILSLMTPYSMGSGDLVTYECATGNINDDNRYQTVMKVGGINPFDPMVLLFIYFIGLMIAILKWIL